MPIVFRTKKISKPKLKGVRQDAYLNGKKLWIQPTATTNISSCGKRPSALIALFDPSLHVTASSNESGRGSITNIIDGLSGTLWQSSGAAPQWIQVTLNLPAIATAYTLTCNGEEPVNLPTSWSIQGRSNETDWTTLHSVTGWDPSDKWEQTWEIALELQKEYLHYRFYCTSVRTPNYWVYLSEWQLFGYK
jgi:hypothetical protein